MKCPKCNFITSNKNDICPRCRIDLRPKKRTIGIPVTNPDASVEQLEQQLLKATTVRIHSVPTSDVEQTTLSDKKKKKGVLSWLKSGSKKTKTDQVSPAKSTLKPISPTPFAPPSVGKPLQSPSPAPAKSDPVPPMNSVFAVEPEQTSESSEEVMEALGLETIAPEKPATEAKTPTPAEDSDLNDLFDDAYSTASADEDGLFDADKLFDIASAVGEGVQEAKKATESLAKKALSTPKRTLEQTPEEPQETPTEELQEQSLDFAAPEVVEFGEDDDLLEQKLDELIGDMVLDIETVNKKPAEEPEEQDGDCILFNSSVEMSLDIESDQETDGALFGDLAELKQTPAPNATAEETTWTDEKEQLLQELASMVAEFYGVEVESIFREPPEPIDSEIRALENELLAELEELMREGTTFHGEEEFAVARETDESEEAGLSEQDELADLEAELAAEIQALENDCLRTSITDSPKSDSRQSIEEMARQLADSAPEDQ